MTSDQGSTGPADETAPLPVGEEARQQNSTPMPTSPPPSSPPPGYEPSGSPGVLQTTSASTDSDAGAEKVTGDPAVASGGADAGTDASDDAVATGSEADRIRAEIEHTRAELGDTVDALSAKLDVKGRVQEKRAEVTETVKVKANEGVAVAKDTVAKVQDAATDDQGKPTPPAMGAAAGAGFLLVLVLFLRRRRKKRKKLLD